MKSIIIIYLLGLKAVAATAFGLENLSGFNATGLMWSVPIGGENVTVYGTSQVNFYTSL